MADKTADREERWTIRGIGPAFQRRIRTAAKSQRLTVGEAVTEALEAWLKAIQEPARGDTKGIGSGDAPEALARIEARLNALERQVYGSAPPQNKAREPAPVDPKPRLVQGQARPKPAKPILPRDDPRWIPIREQALTLVRQGLTEKEVAKRLSDGGIEVSKSVIGKWRRAAEAELLKA
jgi:hypothetical protein